MDRLHESCEPHAPKAVLQSPDECSTEQSVMGFEPLGPADVHLPLPWRSGTTRCVPHRLDLAHKAKAMPLPITAAVHCLLHPGGAKQEEMDALGTGETSL